MKWFKHKTACTSDPDHMESETLFKANGPYVFWRTLEILSREDATEGPLVMNFDAFSHWFPSISKKKLIEILHYFDKKNRFSFHLDGKNISISCHKLSCISSGYAQKVRNNFEKCPSQNKNKNKKENKNNNTVSYETAQTGSATEFEIKMNALLFDSGKSRGDYVRMFRSSIRKTPLNNQESIRKIDQDLGTSFGTIINFVQTAPEGQLQGGLGILRGYQK